jgi:hypothetical protein
MVLHAIISSSSRPAIAGFHRPINRHKSDLTATDFVKYRRMIARDGFYRTGGIPALVGAVHDREIVVRCSRVAGKAGFYGRARMGFPGWRPLTLLERPMAAKKLWIDLLGRRQGQLLHAGMDVGFEKQSTDHPSACGLNV